VDLYESDVTDVFTVSLLASLARNLLIFVIANMICFDGTETLQVTPLSRTLVSSP